LKKRGKRKLACRGRIDVRGVARISMVSKAEGEKRSETPFRAGWEVITSYLEENNFRGKRRRKRREEGKVGGDKARGKKDKSPNGKPFKKTS